ncbi:MAG: DUF2911 domain-containing protein [Bacteroidota bacterium]
MKIPLSLVVLLFLACNNKKEDNGTATDSPALKRDSNISANTEQAINPYAGVDISPMDMSYYPVDYPKLKMGKAATSPPLARVIYSRPHLQGRHIFREVLQYGQPWRLGANESTELDLYADVIIQDKKIIQGRYVLYCIPQPKEWTIVLNSNSDSWGLQPDPSKDVARFAVPVTKNNFSLEYFTITFQKKDSGADLMMAWDSVEVRLPLRF